MRTQRRTICRGCRRELIFSTSGLDVCPGCGSASVEAIEFQGLFDSATPRDISLNAPELAVPVAGQPSPVVMTTPMAMVGA